MRALHVSFSKLAILSIDLACLAIACMSMTQALAGRALTCTIAHPDVAVVNCGRSSDAHGHEHVAAAHVHEKVHEGALVSATWESISDHSNVGCNAIITSLRYNVTI